MVRDSNSLQSSCKADAALADHVRLRSCFISPSIPVAPNARFSVPPMHVTGRTRGGIEPHRHPIATWYISLKIDHGGHPIQLGKCLKMVRFEATPPGPPILTSFAKSNLSQARQLAFVKKNPSTKGSTRRARNTQARDLASPPKKGLSSLPCAWLPCGSCDMSKDPPTMLCMSTLVCGKLTTFSGQKNACKTSPFYTGLFDAYHERLHPQDSLLNGF